MNKLEKNYQVWSYNVDSGYSLTEYDTVQEAITATKYSSDWYITKKVDIEITAKEV